MKKALEIFKTIMITGVLVVLPVWLAVLLLLQLLLKLGVIVKPISGLLPEEVNHPTLISFCLFLLLCLLVGLLFHTAIGRAAGRALEGTVLHRIPGYSPLRNIANQMQDFEHKEGFEPALIEVEDGCLSPAFLIETHNNELCTVFMPSVPTPLAGNIFIMPKHRVHPIDVPFPTMMRCVSKWGAGSQELIDAMEKAKI